MTNTPESDTIKITITVKRYIANEIESAIVKYIGGEGEPDDDDTELLNELNKASRVFGRAYMRNKKVK